MKDHGAAMTGDNTNTRGMTLVAACSFGLAAALIAGLYALGYIQITQKDILADRAIAKMPLAALEQKEFPLPYITWMTKYCLVAESGRKFTPDQQVNYCACFIGEKAQRMTMKEQNEAITANWDPRLIPVTQKKLNAMDALCLQKALQ